jgi:hypothetical protein
MCHDEGGRLLQRRCKRQIGAAAPAEEGGERVFVGLQRGAVRSRDAAAARIDAAAIARRHRIRAGFDAPVPGGLDFEATRLPDVLVRREVSR